MISTTIAAVSTTIDKKNYFPKNKNFVFSYMLSDKNVLIIT